MKRSVRLKRAALYLWQEWLRPALFIAGIVFPLKSAVALSFDKHHHYRPRLSRLLSPLRDNP